MVETQFRVKKTSLNENDKAGNYDIAADQAIVGPNELMNYAHSPTFKWSMRDYEDMDLRVGEKVSVEIKKKGNS